MAKPILVANWKNHPGSLSEAGVLLKQLSGSARLYQKLSLFIAPPLPYLESVSLRTGNFAHLALQDFPASSDGTHTGMVTPDILKSFGVKLAIIGHSERRALGETNDSVAQKVKAALRSGILSLVCVGELSRDQDGEHFEFLREQIKLSLAGLNRKTDISKLALAYEPVWAIGKRADDAITPADLSQSVIFIKKVLVDMFGRTIAERIPILYGGAVEPVDATALFGGTGIKGFLVGHASLNAKSFKTIAESLIRK
ncbi:MAG: triose-phosphate isomerase family protein [bacterium]|nr:triose-phosphate isomerase family protein [bacterium]